MSISSWVLSIAGVSILSVLIDLFLPEGSISGHIKTIFNFFIIFIIIAPIPRLVNQEFDSSTLFTNQEITIQENYIYQLNRDKLTLLETTIEANLEKQGYLNIDISISADIFTLEMVIDAIYVDLDNLVIQENGQHINIKNEVLDIITSFVDIEKENIVFNE